MISTPAFILLSLSAATAILLCLRFISVGAGASLARWLWWACLVLGGSALLKTIATSTGAIPPGAIAPTVTAAMIFRLWLPIGATIAAVVVLLAMRVRRPSLEWGGALAFVRSPWLVRALALSVAFSFVAAEIGKLTHDAEMRRFFADSGLAAWINYAVIGLELLGAVGLLRPRWRRAAAVCLAVLMVGAISVHANNSDPFTDSLEALHLLVILLGVVALAGDS